MEINLGLNRHIIISCKFKQELSISNSTFNCGMFERGTIQIPDHTIYLFSSIVLYSKSSSIRIENTQSLLGSTLSDTALSSGALINFTY